MPDPQTGQPDPDELRRNLAITLGSQAPVLPEHLGMPAGPQMAAPGPITMPDQGNSPNLAITPPTVKGPRGTLDADKAERSRLISTGPGESQIYGKVTNSNFGQAHPLIGKILGGLGQGIATAGDIGLSAVAPAIAMNIPGTAYHHAQELRGVNKQIGAEEGEAGKEAQTAETQARVPLTQAQTEHVQTETAGLPAQEQATLEHTQAETQALNRPDLAHAYGTAVDKAIKEGRDPSTDPVVQHLADAITSIQKQPTAKGEEHVNLVGPNGKPIAANYHPDTGKYTDSGGKEIANPQPYEKSPQTPGITMIVPNGEGGGTVQRLTAGQTVAPGAQTAQGVNTMNTPTTTMRTAAGRAATVVSMAPEVLAEIDRLAPQLGPISGRWNDFMQGKVGMDNPDFAGLRTDLMMMSSAVALAHAQGRLPENLRQEFDHMINAPQQTPENLKSVINHVLPWLQKMQEGGQGPQSKGQPQGAAPAATHRWNPATGEIEEINK